MIKCTPDQSGYIQKAKAVREDRLCFLFSSPERNVSKTALSPPQNATAFIIPLFTGCRRRGTKNKRYVDEDIRVGLFAEKKPPVSSTQAALGYMPQPPHPPPPQGPPPRKGLGAIGRTGPTLKGFAPCFRFAAESSRSVSVLPHSGQGGQASLGPTMSSNSQEQEEQ